MRFRAAATPGLLLPLLIALLSCTGASSGPPAGPAGKDAKPAGPGVPVTVAPVVRKEVPVQLSAIGNVQAYSTVTVKALVEGTLTEVHFKEGQHVKKGDPLFTIDPRPFEVKLKQAQATFIKDKTQAELARREAIRYEELAGKEFVSREQAEQMRAAADAAEATLLVDQASVEDARLQLEYCSIRSPIDGVAGALLVYAGNLVKANDPDHPLVVIQQVSPIFVAFSVPAQQLPDVKRYMAKGPLKVTAAPSTPGAPSVAGTLSFLDNTVDLSTGMIQLKAVFQNERMTLWPGQFVTVTLTLTTRPDTVVVPLTAVQTGQRGLYLFVVKPDQTVESRSVTAGATLGGERIIEQGVQPGEQVVTDGQSRLVPGVKVQVKADAGASVGGSVRGGS